MIDVVPAGVPFGVGVGDGEGAGVGVGVGAGVEPPPPQLTMPITNASPSVTPMSFRDCIGVFKIGARIKRPQSRMAEIPKGKTIFDDGIFTF